MPHQILASGLVFLLWCAREGLTPAQTAETLRSCENRFRVGLREQNQHVYALKHTMKVDVDAEHSHLF